MTGGSTNFQEKFTNAKGLSIYYKAWLPKDKMKGLVIFMHGIGEHCNRYSHVFPVLADAGLAVFALDHHGHGQSEGKRVTCESLSHYTDDGHQLTQIALEYLKTQPEKLFLMGISFGALLSAHMALSKKYEWDGLILAAGAIGVEMNCILKVQKVASSLMNALIPNAFLVPAVDPKHMSKDPEAVKSYMEDPLVVNGNLRVCVGYNILKGMKELEERRSELTLPILVLHGTADQCTSPVASEELVQHVSSADKTFQPLDGLYHCIFHEPEQQIVINCVKDWLLDH